jgi:uncharacterized membrane protein YeaQ/YmgE (transglycosylase-associated protein family)
MTKTVSQNTRSWFATIIPSLIGLIIIVFTILLLPIDSVPKGLFVAGAIVAVFLCILFAIEGKKGTVEELIATLLLF